MWPTGGSIYSPFGARTLLLAPLVSVEGVHDLHGVVLDLLDALILSLSPFSQRNATAAESPLSGSLLRARARTTLHRHPPKFTSSSAVPCSSISTT